MFRFGVINQNPAHHLSRDPEEVSAVLPVHLGLINQPQISLVHKRGGLQRVTGGFHSQVPVSHSAQFLIYSLNHVIERSSVSTVPGNQPGRDLLLTLITLLM